MKWITVLPGALVLACVTTAPRNVVPGPPVAFPVQNSWSDLTRGLLAVHCGRCHRGDLPTAPPRALTVFDLSEEPWYGRLQGEQFDGILTRLRATGVLDPEDEVAVVRFIACAREGRCGPPDAEEGE